MRSDPDANELTIPQTYSVCGVMSQRETGWKCINVHPQISWKLKPTYFA
jgi:hypothetical protein